MRQLSTNKIANDFRSFFDIDTASKLLKNWVNKTHVNAVCVFIRNWRNIVA